MIMKAPIKMTKSEIRAGIAAYHRAQQVFLRLLRKRGSFTEQEFDAWFKDREFRRPTLSNSVIHEDSFILGIGLNGGTFWAEMLDLLQYMMILELVDARRENGVLVYFKRKPL